MLRRGLMSGKNYSGSSNLFYVTGSTNKDVDPSKDGVAYYSHLEIGEGVEVTQLHYDALISVVELNRTSVAQKAYAKEKCVPDMQKLSNTQFSEMRICLTVCNKGIVPWRM